RRLGHPSRAVLAPRTMPRAGTGVASSSGQTRREAGTQSQGSPADSPAADSPGTAATASGGNCRRPGRRAGGLRRPGRRRHRAEDRVGCRDMSARAFHAVDPRSGETGPAFTEATPDDVHRAAAAAAAFAAPALRDDGRRAELLSEAAGRLRGAAEEIVAVCQAETGLPEVRVRSELERTWRQLEAFGAVVEAG